MNNGSCSAAAAELGERLLDVYQRLYAFYGPQHWWPGDTPFEVIIGAILTQSAAWVNVEKAINNLKAAGALTPTALRAISLEELASLVYPSGYYRAKARKVKAFVQYLGERYSDSLDALFQGEVASLRRELLSVYGIGEETADSILLYAGGKPVFVVDAYTRRIMSRLGLSPPQDTYAHYQAMFHDNLPPDPGLFNEYHALLVQHGKTRCHRRDPLSGGCPLRDMCLYAARLIAPRGPSSG
ncbi:MAG: endonuclease III domain-containing protein [Chloroflexi bacterium]|nr:endonuclease III domain-containing protein [Chloroflexota bacterium]